MIRAKNLSGILKGRVSSQVFKYAVVGLLNNLRGYLIYLLITALWLDPKVAVAIMYPVGAALGYFAHARYSFSYEGNTSHGVVRYFLAHLLGYSTNLGMIKFFSDYLGYPHQLVQVAAIVAVAGLLFILFRYFVFPNQSRSY